MTCRPPGTMGWSACSGSRCRAPVDGVLQDVHWSAGLMGYFPTYTLGNLIAAQLWERLRDDLAGRRRPDRARRVRAAARVAARATSTATAASSRRGSCCGGSPARTCAVDPFLRYLREKLADAGVLATAA